MNILVVGGSGSGKSCFAEHVACSLAPSRTYIATMRHDGTEAQARIARHREQRRRLDFQTRECPDSLPHGERCCGIALVEDLGNLVANNLFAADGTMASETCVTNRLFDQVIACSQCFDHLIVVSNEVGCEGLAHSAGTRAWVRLMGTLNCRLAATFDAVVEVVAGRPSVLKGSLP